MSGGSHFLRLGILWWWVRCTALVWTRGQLGFGSLSHQQPAEPCASWVFVNQGNVTVSTKWLPPIELQQSPRFLVLAL